MNTGKTLSQRASVAFPTVFCAIAFFLASADRLFSVRTDGVNVRLATVLLFVAFAVFAVTRARKFNDDIRALAIAWLPFVSMYGLAAATSETPAPGMLKLGWFAFDFLVAFATIALFDVRNVARGYFLSYLAVASIIAIDFLSGFTRGTAYMIGYAQVNNMVPGMLLYRPHAFYYEPSFAAGGLALAWVLALTRMRDVAPKLASALVIVGASALVVMTSRIGWIYASVATAAAIVFYYRERRLRPLLMRASIPIVLIAGALAGVITFSDKREAFGGLINSLGFVQAFERVCPLIAGRFVVDINCLSGDARREYLGEGQPFNADETTEGLRLLAVRATVATIGQHPWIGVGVGHGSDRFIAPPPVANLWLEVALEGGLLTLMAFTFGVTFTLWRWGAFDARNRDIMIMFALWLLIVWQFIQTFPRLDLVDGILGCPGLDSTLKSRVGRRLVSAVSRRRRAG